MLTHWRVSHATRSAFNHMGVKVLLEEHSPTSVAIGQRRRPNRRKQRGLLTLFWYIYLVPVTHNIWTCQNINNIWAFPNLRNRLDTSCKPSCSNCWRVEIKENISRARGKPYRITTSSKAVLIRTEIAQTGVAPNLFTYFVLAKNADMIVGIFITRKSPKQLRETPRRILPAKEEHLDHYHRFKLKMKMICIFSSLTEKLPNLH